MATGRVTKKVLDYIAHMNKEAKQMSYIKDLKKEVEIGANGTQKYELKKDKTKVRYYDFRSCSSSYDN